jgi:hypothetical protein
MVWSMGGMILTGQNQGTGRKTCPSAALSTTNATKTGLVSNPGLQTDHSTTLHRTEVLTVSLLRNRIQFSNTGRKQKVKRVVLSFFSAGMQYQISCIINKLLEMVVCRTINPDPARSYLDTLTGQPTCTLILEPPRYKIVPII